MLETVLQSKPGVIGLIRSVHGLQVEVLKFQLFEALRQSAFLRKYQLELTPTPYQKLGARFGTYTDPIDAFWNRLGSVRLHGDHETVRMKRCDQGLIELKEWFPASADNESPRPRRAIGRPGSRNRLCKLLRRHESSSSRSVSAKEVGVAKLTCRPVPVLLPSCPQVAAREAAKHCRATGIRPLALKGEEDFLYGVAHTVTSLPG